jgi:hypothetical protein
LSAEFDWIGSHETALIRVIMTNAGKGQETQQINQIPPVYQLKQNQLSTPNNPPREKRLKLI